PGKLPDKFSYRTNSSGRVFAWDKASMTAFRVDSETNFVPIDDTHTSLKVWLNMPRVSREEAESLLKAES
ncbi:MAG TPA: hypothetical protein PLI66_09440, partial [Spirochaetales bacterium]|nr:hypothetical protein [Spirochaetales bacterium]